jgi:hypothetical protein
LSKAFDEMPHTTQLQTNIKASWNNRKVLNFDKSVVSLSLAGYTVFLSMVHYNKKIKIIDIKFQHAKYPKKSGKFKPMGV